MITKPKRGYNFEEKNRYRETIWKIFSQRLNPKTARVLFMPSEEGLEIPVAKKYGFKTKNLVAVDNSPEKMQWRKEYPEIRFYGTDLSEGCR